MMAQNYARAMLFEHQHRKWAASWSIQVRGKKNSGGNFLIASHGIRVMAASNSLVTWQPRHHRGLDPQTFRLYEVDPYYLQLGISLVMLMCFNGIRRKNWESIKEGEEQELASQVAQNDLFGESSTGVPDEHYEEESSQ
ncbi:hypothetical protein AN958_04408 [Leucoagaricus sp. SymC.cos]|nr:hypothetical protein AN958_04408 [Leucoagaricus sp. SymC.cos]